MRGTNLGELRGIGESEDQAIGDQKIKKINFKHFKNIFKLKSFNNFTIPQNWPNLRKTGLQLNFLKCFEFLFIGPAGP